MIKLPTNQEIQGWLQEYSCSPRMMVDDTYYWPIHDVLTAILALNQEPKLPLEVPWRRLKSCVEAWPECVDGEYNPACCRFPKVCSCLADPTKVPEWVLEPPKE